MNRHNRLKKLKVILILVFITSFFLVSLIYTFLRDIPVLISLLEKYFSSGKSFFIPIIPNIYFLWFIPENYHIIKLSIGQLIDIFIISNLITYIDSSFYHYVKSVCLNKESPPFTFFDYDSSGDDEEFRTQSRDLSVLVGLEDQSKKNMNFLNIVFKKKKNYSFNNYLSKKIDNINIIQYKKFKILSFNLNISLRGFYYYSLFNVFSILHLKNRSILPKTSNSEDFYFSFKIGGIKTKKINLSFDFEKILIFKLKNLGKKKVW